jgi:flagellin-like hook-associated protein FlgL
MVTPINPRSLRAAQVIREVQSPINPEGELELQSAITRSDRSDAAKIDRAIERAKTSSAAIVEIRESQSILLQKIKSSDATTRGELISEFNSLNSEVDRITSTSSYNGTNLAEGSLFQLQSAKRLYYGVVSLPRYSTLNSVQSLENTSSSLSSAETSIDNALKSAYIIDGGISARDLKSQKIIMDLARNAYQLDNTKRNRFTSPSVANSPGPMNSDIILMSSVPIPEGDGSDVDLKV